MVFSSIDRSIDRARLGPRVYAGVGAEAELETGLRAYRDGALGIYGDMIFGVDVGAGANFNTGFLNIEAGVGLSTVCSLNTELIFKDGAISTLDFSFEISLEAGVKAGLTFDGLAKPLQDLSYSLEPSRDLILGLRFSIPADQLTQDLVQYFTNAGFELIEPHVLWVKLDQMVSQVPIGYEVYAKYSDDVSIPLGGKMAGVGLDLEFDYVEDNEFTIEQGSFLADQKWSIVTYNKAPNLMSTSSFILNNWIFRSTTAQPSGNVVRLEETQGKLYLHIYDSERRHVGMNHTSGQVDLEIPGAYYYDNMNGTIAVVLPSDLCNFSFEVDGEYAEETSEEYNVMVATITPDYLNETLVESMIFKGEMREYDATISEGTTKVTVATDLNGDNLINNADLDIVCKAFRTKRGGPNWNVIADLDKNGVVNIIDAAMVAKDFGRTF